MKLLNPVVDAVARFPVRVQTKLLLAFLIIAATLVVLGVVGLSILNGMNQRNLELIALQRKIAAYSNVQHDTTRQLYWVTSALLSGEQRGLDHVLRQLNQFGYQLDRLQLVEEDEAELMGEVREDYERFIELVSGAVALAQSSQADAARELQSKDAKRLADRLERRTNQLVNVATANMLDRIATSKQAYEGSRTAVIGISVGSVVLALLLGYISSSSILLPLLQIKTRLREIANGNFNRVIKVRNRDELGSLADDVNRTSSELADLYQQLSDQKTYIEDISTRISRYLPQQLYQSIFRGEMGTGIESRRKHLTIFFSDIRDFAIRTERLEPEALSEILNCYFSSMTEIARAHGATIDKFIGDAILAFFGDPESEGSQKDAEDCIRMAIEMQRRMVVLGESFSKYGLHEPLEIRIGINSGYCTVGNFGSDERMDYTIIGSPVNIAARLQEMCPPNAILISRTTHALTDQKFDFVSRGPLKLKGIGNPVETFEVHFALNTVANADSSGEEIKESGRIDPAKPA